MASRPSSMDLHAGLTNKSPKAIDASYGKRGGASVNDTGRTGVPKVTTPGGRSA